MSPGYIIDLLCRGCDPGGLGVQVEFSLPRLPHISLPPVPPLSLPLPPHPLHTEDVRERAGEVPLTEDLRLHTEPGGTGGVHPGRAEGGLW